MTAAMVFISHIRTKSEVQFHVPVGLPSRNISGINWTGTCVDYRDCWEIGKTGIRASRYIYIYYIHTHTHTIFIMHFRASFLFPCFGSHWWAMAVAYRGEGRFGGFKVALPLEIPKAFQNRAKLNPIVKTVKNC